METFGRGCLYCIIGVAILMLLAMMLRTTINIPWFIFIPLVILAFVYASKKTNNKK